MISKPTDTKNPLRKFYSFLVTFTVYHNGTIKLI